MPHDPIAAKSPFDHNLQTLCHHASRKKTDSASKTPQKTLKTGVYGRALA